MLVEFYCKLNKYLHVYKGDYFRFTGLLILIDFNLGAQIFVICGAGEMGMRKDGVSQAWEYWWSFCMGMSTAVV